MKAHRIIIGLMVVAPLAGRAGNLQMADPDVLKQQRIEWRTISMEELKLKRDLAKVKEQWSALSNAEADSTNLLKQVEQSEALVKALSERGYREWTSAKGAKVFARLSFQSESLVRLKNEQGEEMEIPVANLSPSDRDQLARIARALAQASGPSEAPPEEKFIGLDDTRTKTVPVKQYRKY